MANGLVFKWVLPVVLGTTAVLLAFCIGHRRLPRTSPQIPPVPVASAGNDRLSFRYLDLDGGAAEDRLVNPELAKALIAEAANASARFRAAWHKSVSGAADLVTARVAGARMAGITEVRFAWEAKFPVPEKTDPRMARAAFVHAVHEEAVRRLKDMASPGAFG